MEIFLLSAAVAECIPVGWSVTCDLLPFFVLLCVRFVIFAMTVSSIKQYSYKKMLRGYRTAMGATGSLFFFLPSTVLSQMSGFLFFKSTSKIPQILNVSTVSLE